VKSIVAIGDSITWGFPDGFSWTHLLEEQLGVEILNAGINGDTLEGMLSRLDQDVLVHRPDVCIVMGGSNDAFMGYGIEDMREIVLEIKSRLERNRIRVFFGIPVPALFGELEERLRPFRDWLREQMPDCIPFDAVFLEEGRIRGELLFDGVHPSREGRRLMALVAEDVLAKVVGEGDGEADVGRCR